MASREPPLKTTTEGFDLTALLGFRVFRLSVALAALAEATHPWQQHSPPLPSQDDAPYVRHCSLCYIS